MLKESDADTFVFNYSPTLNIFDNEEIVPDGMVKFLGNTKVNEAFAICKGDYYGICFYGRWL